jgi:hypothetical protein
MGQRTCVQFRTDGRLSVALFSHWGGQEFLDEARAYAADLVRERSGAVLPLDRLEPNTVMVDFIRHITREMTRVQGDFYLGANEREGDATDFGSHVIDLSELRRTQPKRP